jgi:hypothetical protein
VSLYLVTSGRCRRPSRQCGPSSSGVTATGENAVDGCGDERRNQHFNCPPHTFKTHTNLGNKEAKLLLQLGRDQISQRDIVAQHHEPDVLVRLRSRCAPTQLIIIRVLGASTAPSSAHGNVSRDDTDLALEIDAKLLREMGNVASRGNEGARPTLVHERIGSQSGGWFGAASLANQNDMVDVRATIDPVCVCVENV